MRAVGRPEAPCSDLRTRAARCRVRDETAGASVAAVVRAERCVGTTGAGVDVAGAAAPLEASGVPRAIAPT